jgi:hypothetical protein
MLSQRVFSLFLVAALGAPAFGEDLIANAGAEDGTDAPDAWRFGTAWPDSFTGDWSSDAASGKRSLHIVSRTNGMSAYWGQTVQLKPGTKYILKVRTKIASGRVLIYVHNGDLNERLYCATAVPSPLVPVFVKPEWIKDARVDSRYVRAGEWFTAELRFASGKGGAARVSLGSYFLEGEMFFDDVTLEEAGR